MLKKIPDKLGAAGLGVLVTALSGLALSMLTTQWLDLYGWTLFVGVPFFCGFTSVYIYAIRESRSLQSCLAVSTLSIVLLGALLTACAVDGLICILMAAPLALAIATPGGVLGYMLARRLRRKDNAALPVTGMLLLLPLLMGFESKLNTRPPLTEVITSIDVAADPATIWKYVIAFPPIPPPREPLFKTGIAYPLDARIDGAGVGAVRYCNFSTGSFVEPIRVWQPPTLLKFDVTQNPSPMREISFYHDLQPAHLHNFMISRAGQFKLIPLNRRMTRLEGTTWYYHRLWPIGYWRIFSDAIIHKIHYRVLNHIKEQAERAPHARG